MFMSTIYLNPNNQFTEIFQIKDIDAACEYAIEFAQKNGVPACDEVQMDEKGNIMMKWGEANLAQWEGNKRLWFSWLGLDMQHFDDFIQYCNKNPIFRKHL